MATLNIRIQLRNDTAENWNNVNPILLKGEMGVEIDTGKTKIGNGTADWKTLKYSGVDEDTIKGIIDKNRNAVEFIEANEGETDAQALARVITAPKKGDIGIVEQTKNGIGEFYTAYIHDGTGFKAMDGNYSADNVYFDEDFTYTANIGVLTVPGSGSGTIQASGKNVKEVLAGILAKEKNPSATAPAVTIGTQTNFGTFEIGTTKNLVYGATLSAGSYTYGPATGITAKTWEATCTGVTGSKTTASGTFENVVAEATAKTITVKATYDAGAIPVTNLGNQYPAGQIKAGSASKVSGSLVGVRYMFWGPMSDASAELNSANIRALAHKEESKAKTLATFGAGAGAKKIVVAVPTGRRITKVLLTSAMNADITSIFVKQGTQSQVEGTEGYTAAAYDVYVYQPASIGAGETYAVTIG